MFSCLSLSAQLNKTFCPDGACVRSSDWKCYSVKMYFWYFFPNVCLVFHLFNCFTFDGDLFWIPGLYCTSDIMFNIKTIIRSIVAHEEHIV